jgi:hemolysin activation/secretion protein
MIDCRNKGCGLLKLAGGAVLVAILTQGFVARSESVISSKDILQNTPTTTCNQRCEFSAVSLLKGDLGGSQPSLLPTKLATSPVPLLPGEKRLGNEGNIAQLPDREPLPEVEPLPPLPPANELLPTPPPTAPVPEFAPGDTDVTIFVNRFDVIGSTVFSPEELAIALAPFTHRSLTLTELYQARSAVTQLYLDAGYVNSGAYVPPQVPEDGVVTIQVIEGRVTDIQITGNRRLQDAYVRRRLAIATPSPLNIRRLVEALQLLQLDPLIASISAELSADVEPGTDILTVAVTEADSFSVDLTLDNARSPAVGTDQRAIEFNQANLLGLGDALSVGYTHTNGSNEIDASYTIPINPRNGTVRFNYGFTDSHVVENPFDVLDIDSQSYNYELSYRQPIIQTPTEELALSLVASRQESRSLFLEDLLGEPIPLPTLGADAEGRIRVSALRFVQEWTRRSSQEVFAVRSQFSLGLDLLDSTINDDAPDSRFFSWYGQGQWVRLLAPDTLLLVQAEAQLADSALVPLEQIGFGGVDTVRGYRQNLFLTDNGVLLRAETRIPIYRNRRIQGLLQIAPFFDLGFGWNVDRANPDPNTLIGLGLGLQWQQGDRFNARLDWGIPLVDIDDQGDTLQENGIYFSVRYSAF